MSPAGGRRAGPTLDKKLNQVSPYLIMEPVFHLMLVLSRAEDYERLRRGLENVRERASKVMNINVIIIACLVVGGTY